MKRDTFTDEVDAALADAASRYCRDRFAFDERQRLPQARRRFDASAWAEMADMGWIGVAVDEADGGLGRRIGSIALLARKAGASFINEPLLSAFAAAEVLRAGGTAQQRERWLPALMAGKLRVACAFEAEAEVRTDRLAGRAEVVPDGDLADLLLVRIDGRWYAVSATAPGLRRTAYPLVDGRGAATLVFDDCPAEALHAKDDSGPASVAALAAAADALGAMETAFELTLEYAKTRKQFGAAIGSNQAVVHRIVDMFIRLEESRAVLAQATEALACGDPARAGEVHAAKAFIPPQGRLLAQEAVQLHGGIGITEEYAVSHCLRRVLVDEQLFGSAQEHLRRFAAQPIPR